MEEKIKKNTVICILGMHRSGTSMITRILNICGLDLGEECELFNRKDGSNKRGHWENLEILRINEEILSVFGGSWKNPPFWYRDRWEDDKRLESLYKEAREFVGKMNKRYSFWGFKEPRTCLTLPFWQKVIPNMKYVVVIRHPEEISHSLEKRSGIILNDGILLWMTYFSSILHFINKDNSVFTFYENYFIDAESELKKIGDFISNNNFDAKSTFDKVKDFINFDLYHNKSAKKSYQKIDINYHKIVDFAVESFIGRGVKRNHEFIIQKKQIIKLKKQINQKNKDLIKLQYSKPFLVGGLFFRSIKKPYKLITFPVNLIRILVK